MLHESRATHRMIVLNIMCWYANIPPNEVTSNMPDTQPDSKTAREV